MNEKYKNQHSYYGLSIKNFKYKIQFLKSYYMFIHFY